MIFERNNQMKLEFELTSHEGFYTKYDLKLSTILDQEIITIKLDQDYMLALYSLIVQLYINSLDFGITFPIYNTMEITSINMGFNSTETVVCESGMYYMIIETRRFNGLVTRTVINNITLEDLSEMISLIEQYAFQYMSDEQFDDIDSSTIELTNRMIDRERQRC